MHDRCERFAETLLLGLAIIVVVLVFTMLSPILLPAYLIGWVAERLLRVDVGESDDT